MGRFGVPGLGYSSSKQASSTKQEARAEFIAYVEQACREDTILGVLVDPQSNLFRLARAAGIEIVFD